MNAAIKEAYRLHLIVHLEMRYTDTVSPSREVRVQQIKCDETF